ncbi:MAG TPA: efflux RND transporter permease subunit, partial [Candidatus Brocadiia bacterium]|nr:efflux RND transporter permease subunit [Candidatus Brocadiia bacterium]
IGNLRSAGGRYDSLFLANYAILNMQDTIARVPGVGDVKVYPSGKDYSLRVWMDPGLLQARGLDTTDVINALKEQNVQVAAGQLGQAPSLPGQTFQYTVTALGRLRDVDQFNDIILKTSQDGRIVHLRDVARVEIGSQTYDTTSHFNGEPSSTLVVYQLPGSNALRVASGVKKVIEQLSKEFPDGVRYEMIWDLSDFVGASVREVVVTLIEAFILVAIVVFIFLGNFRATMIPITTVPVSLIGAFMVMSAMGFSINTLTLFGLVLAIGIVVDDAIVVTENAQRIIDEEGLPPREATIKAMEEITGPVIGITLVLMAVFLPTAFLPGIAGQLYRQFALTIAATTAISALNALTLKPAQCAVFLKKRPAKASLFNRLFDAAFGKVAALHSSVARFAVRRLAIAALLYLAFVTLAALGFLHLPTGFIPQEDQGLIAVNVQMPSAASSVRNTELLQQAQEAARRVPGIKDVVMIGGFSMLDQVSASDVGFGFISLKPWEERYNSKNRDTQNLNAIAARLRQELGKLQAGAVVSFPLPPILGLGSSAGFRMQLLDKAG